MDVFNIRFLLKSKKIPIVFTLHNYRMILHKIGLFNKYLKNMVILKIQVATYFISRYLNKNTLIKTDTFITHTDFTKNIYQIWNRSKKNNSKTKFY